MITLTDSQRAELVKEIIAYGRCTYGMGYSDGSDALAETKEDAVELARMSRERIHELLMLKE